MTYLLEVVMLATYTQALLGIGRTLVWPGPATEEDILKLIHARIRK